MQRFLNQYIYRFLISIFESRFTITGSSFNEYKEVLAKEKVTTSPPIFITA